MLWVFHSHKKSQTEMEMLTIFSLVVDVAFHRNNSEGMCLAALKCHS